MSREERARELAERYIWKCKHGSVAFGDKGGQAQGDCTPTPIDELIPQWRISLTKLLVEFANYPAKKKVS